MLRADVDGKIYVARVESGTVDVVDPQSGTVIRHVPLTGKNPTNLTFGGSDGKTVFVTQAEGGYVECQGRAPSAAARDTPAPPASWPALGRPSTPLPCANAGGCARRRLPYPRRHER